LRDEVSPEAGELDGEPEARPSVDPRIWSRRVAVTRARGRKRLKIAGAAILVVVLGLGAVASLHSGLFSAHNLKVEGAVHTPSERILARAGLLSHPPLIDINEKVAAERIEALPWIKTARITQHWPDSVTVVVTERSAVGAIDPPDATAGPTTWAIVDSSGRVLEDTRVRPLGLLTLLVAAAPGAPGSYLSGTDRPALDVASSLPADLSRRVAAVEIEPAGTVNLALAHDLTGVIGLPVDLPAKYAALLSVLSGAALAPGDVIDVSVPQEPTVGAS
jgi:cell division protein FtsQ